MNFYRNFSFLVVILLMTLANGCTNPTGTCTEDCPDPIEKEGPGEIKLAEDTVCSEANKNTGEIIVLSVENGYEAIWLEDDDGERVPGFYSDGFTPQNGQDHVFSAVPVGNYYVVAERNGKESRSRLVTVDECEVEKIPPTAQCSFEDNGLTVNFDASGSSDSDGDIVSYEWKFGDGNSSSGVDPEHTYAESGSYDVTVTVTDNHGLSDEATCDVTVEQPLSEEFAHEVNYNLNGSKHLAVSPSNKSSELISYGELKPIRTDEDPAGTVRIEIDHHAESSESNEDFSLNFVCGDDGREFSTETVKDTGANGWTTSELTLDAKHFKAKELCKITARSEGSGEVIFSDKNKPGKMFFYWKVLKDGQWKTSSIKFETNIED